MKVFHPDSGFDLFSPTIPDSAVFVTTNGVVKTDGRAVMGAGCAKVARDRFHADVELGKRLSLSGNHVYCLMKVENPVPFYLVSFPTKRHYRSPSDLSLIEQSALEAVQLANDFDWRIAWLPAPGCGLGGLDWEKDVYPVLSGILDNRFVVVVR